MNIIEMTCSECNTVKRIMCDFDRTSVTEYAIYHIKQSHSNYMNNSMKTKKIDTNTFKVTIDGKPVMVFVRCKE